MIFFGETFWHETLPVMPLLEALFVGRKGMSKNEFNQHVAVVATVDEAVERLLGTEPSGEKTIARMESLGYAKMLASVR